MQIIIIKFINPIYWKFYLTTQLTIWQYPVKYLEHLLFLFQKI